MGLRETSEQAEKEFSELIGNKVIGTVSAQKEEDGYRLKIEVLERKAVPDSQNLIGEYDIVVDGEGEIESYERVELRRKGQPKGGE